VAQQVAGSASETEKAIGEILELTESLQILVKQEA
jgi:hypothetical protein